DHSIDWAHSGSNQAWMRHDTGWIDIHQDVEVEPYTTYDLSAFLTTGGEAGTGALGVRQIGPGGDVLASAEFTEIGENERHALTFNSGPNSTVGIYVGSDLDGDRWVQVDDVTLMRAQEQDPVWELALSA